MKLLPQWLARCLNLQVVEEGCLFTLTPFGRALLKGPNKWGEDDSMLYWVRLPSYEWRRTDYGRRYGWLQRTLFFHGREGFSIGWAWVDS